MKVLKQEYLLINDDFFELVQQINQKKINKTVYFYLHYLTIWLFSVLVKVGVK